MTPADKTAAQRRRLNANEQASQRALARQYGQAWQKVRRQLQDLLDAIAAARAAGVTVDAGWLAQHNELLLGVEGRALVAVRAFVEVANRTISKATAAALIAGAVDAHDLARAVVPSQFPLEPGLPADELARVAADLRTGAPLRSLLDELPFDAARRVRETIVIGVAAGDGPRQLARDLQTSLAGNLARALRISRTEVIGAYRRSAVARYQEHADVIDGWIWTATLDGGTCGACLAMHGSFHELSEQMDSHPNCRCAPVPHTKTAKELGITDPKVKETRLVVEPGEEWFARQPRATQLQVLGPSKLAAYEAGQIKLRDLVQPTVDPVWGHGIRERSLRDLDLPVVQLTRTLEESLRLQLTRATTETMQPAVAAVGKLIETTLPAGRIAVREDPSLPWETRGWYKSTGEIGLNPGSANPDTLAHELGHAIDHRVLGNQRYASENLADRRMAGWRAAVVTSDAHQALLARLASAPTVGYERHLGYLLRWREEFARSFAQWVALRSGDEALAAKMTDVIADQISADEAERQWTWNDFGPIAQALDELFADAGVLRSGSTSPPN